MSRKLSPGDRCPVCLTPLAAVAMDKKSVRCRPCGVIFPRDSGQRVLP